MGDIEQIADWRARRAARFDTPMGAPPFVLEEPCPGCGQPRVATMVWRHGSESEAPSPIPRMSPHFVCQDGEVLWQEVTDAGITLSGSTGILGHFEDRALRGA